uniref:Uncharacterized protein n=1 Tax=Anguilla anguilla TaxID=7936 RepID=A0A0E9WYG1_ANGAN
MEVFINYYCLELKFLYFKYFLKNQPFIHVGTHSMDYFSDLSYSMSLKTKTKQKN